MALPSITKKIAIYLKYFIFMYLLVPSITFFKNVDFKW